MTDIAQDFGFSNWREAEYATGLTGSRLNSYTSTLKGYASGPFEDAASLEVIFDSMPTVLRIGPYRFFFVSLDRGEPPHIHVRRESMVAKFWLDPIALQQAGGYSRAELNTISRLVQEHRQTLLEGWYEFFGR
jgi:hypothetical protein